MRRLKSATALGFIEACESRLRTRVVPEIRNPTVSTQVGGCRLLKMNFLTASIVRASCRGRRDLRGGVTSTTKSRFSSSQQPTAMKMYFITPQRYPRRACARLAIASDVRDVDWSSLRQVADGPVPAISSWQSMAFNADLS